MLKHVCVLGETKELKAEREQVMGGPARPAARGLLPSDVHHQDKQKWRKMAQLKSNGSQAQRHTPLMPTLERLRKEI